MEVKICCVRRALASSVMEGWKVFEDAFQLLDDFFTSVGRGVSVSSKSFRSVKCV